VCSGSIRGHTESDLHAAEGDQALIDTHSHLLPYVDHGCPDLRTSLLMARAAVASGIDTVFCTPHLPESDPTVIADIRTVAEEVRAALADNGIALTLRLGFEVDLAVVAAHTPGELAELTVEGTAGALVLEMPYHGWPNYLEEALFRLSAKGLRPVLAHPERNDHVQRDPKILEACTKAGTVVQATAASLTGEFGKATERTLTRMVSLGLVGLLASDAHAYRTDNWTLASALERLSGKIDPEGLRVLVDENPRRLMEGRSLLQVGMGGRSSPRSPWRRR